MPDDNNKIVFTKGKPQTSRCCVPNGGHTIPIAIEGAKLKWKKAQKNAKKNIISETINNNMPILNPAWTFWVWKPSADSLTIAKNQFIIVIKSDKIAKWNNSLRPGISIWCI